MNPALQGLKASRFLPSLEDLVPPDASTFAEVHDRDPDDQSMVVCGATDDDFFVWRVSDRAEHGNLGQPRFVIQARKWSRSAVSVEASYLVQADGRYVDVDGVTLTVHLPQGAGAETEFRAGEVRPNELGPHEAYGGDVARAVGQLNKLVRRLLSLEPA